MTGKHPYTYTVLRYVHDPLTGEFVNIGVVVHCPSLSYLNAKLRSTHGRISAVFPDLSRTNYKALIGGIERAFRRVAKGQGHQDLFPTKGNALSFARRVVPADDSSLQWSSIGSGITADPESTLNRLYDRLVGQYDRKYEGKRSDDDVWRPVRDYLEKRDIASRLTPKTIAGSADTIEFDHAWRNGLWHCYQPVSFDLANSETIRDKARKWTGHITSVSDSQEPFKVYFLVAPPQDSRLHSAFEAAVAILQKAPIEKQVFAEEQIGEFIEQIETDVEAGELHSQTP